MYENESLEFAAQARLKHCFNVSSVPNTNGLSEEMVLKVLLRLAGELVMLL